MDIQVLLIFALSLAVILVISFYMGNKRLSFAVDELSDDETESESNSPLAEIFYLYDHNSEKEWVNWINNQDKHVRVEALKLISDHLEGLPKHWGSVTSEAIKVLVNFKDLKSDLVLEKFFRTVSKLWGEYKSIPGYYEITAETLAATNPTLLVRLFNEELDKRSNVQSVIEKRKIIIDTLPLLEWLGVSLINSVINDSREVFTLRVEALQTAKQFNGEQYRAILLEGLGNNIDKCKSSVREIRTEDSQILQDIIKESVKMIGQKDFFLLFKEACNIWRLQEIIIPLLIKRINDENTVLNINEIYAMTKLRDNSSFELRKTLAQIRGLDTLEINNLLLEKVCSEITEENLTKNKLDEDNLSVPNVFKSQYEDFKELFFQSTRTDMLSECEKKYGGVLVTGDAELEKLYFSKALAQEKKWNYAVVDINDIHDKTSYNNFCSVFHSLRKPYLLYIKNPEALYSSVDNNSDNNYKAKFAQTLFIQAIDAKSFLVGSIARKVKEINDEYGRNSLIKLRTVFFAQGFEMNERKEKIKTTIAEDYLRFVNSHRFESRSEVIEDLLKHGSDKNVFEFAFFVLDTLATMLLVFGKNVPYIEIKRLEERLRLDKPPQEEALPEMISSVNLDESGI